MHLKRFVLLGMVCFFVSFNSSVIAQNQDAGDEDACSALVEDALAQIDDLCRTIGRNQACYGHTLVHATGWDEIALASFEEPGDSTSILDVALLNVAPLDLETHTWGMALMALQANLPGTLPGQNVTFIVFGDVQIRSEVPPDDQVIEPVTIEASARSGINVRSGPGTNFSVLRGLTSGTVVSAEGRNNAADWVRIQLPDDGGTGWVSAPLVTIEGDTMTLAVVDASVTDAAGVTYGPMQAFTFRSGVGASQCAEAPQDGMLIQTPQGVGTVELLVNEVTINLGSTAYLQAVPGDVMTISMLEGLALVTAFDVSVYAPAGTMVIIPLDTNGVASGVPVVQRYTTEQVASLPIALLEESIVVAPPVDPAAVDTPPDVTGIWRLESFVFVNCPAGDAFLFDVEYGFVLENRFGGFAVLETLAGRGGPTPGVSQNPSIWEYMGGGEFVSPNGFAVTMLSPTQGLSVSILDLSQVTDNSCTNTIEIPFNWSRS